jgi:hypothetical protein
MVEDAVEDHLDVALAGGVEECPERRRPAEQWIDLVVVPGVVAMVRCGREDRVEVEAADPEVGELVEPVGQPVEVPALEAERRGPRLPRLQLARSRDPAAPRDRSGKIW